MRIEKRLVIGHEKPDGRDNEREDKGREGEDGEETEGDGDNEDDGGRRDKEETKAPGLRVREEPKRRRPANDVRIKNGEESGPDHGGGAGKTQPCGRPRCSGCK